MKWFKPTEKLPDIFYVGDRISSDYIHLFKSKRCLIENEEIGIVSARLTCSFCNELGEKPWTGLFWDTDVDGACDGIEGWYGIKRWSYFEEEEDDG